MNTVNHCIVTRAILRERLAEIYFESNFLDYAGLYWMLTEPKTENIKLAQDTYLQSVNYSSYKILNDIRFCGDRRLLTDYARNTIIKLEKDCEKKKIMLPKFKRKSNKKRVQHQTEDTSGCFGKYLGAFIVIFFIIILLLGLQSLFTIIKSFFYN